MSRGQDAVAPETVTPDAVVAALTPPQRHALWRAQEQLFEGKATVTGHGMTMRALRARGVIIGAMPYAYVTPFGRDVMRLAFSNSSDPA